VAQLEVNKGVVSSYVHNAVIEGPARWCDRGARIAGKAEELSALGRQLAMHVADQSPALDGGLDQRRQARKGRAGDKYRQQGKAENVIEKIVDPPEDYYKKSALEQASSTTAQVGRQRQGS